MLIKFLWEYTATQEKKLIDYEDFIERYLLDKNLDDDDEEEAKKKKKK